MFGHRRAGRAHQLMRPPEPAVEQEHELFVVAAVIAENETFELGIALVPRLRAMAEQRLQVIEICLGASASDLIEAGQMTGQAERGALLILGELVRGRQAA